MSQENVEIVRWIFEGFQEAIERGDPAAWIADTVPDDYEWIVPGEFAGRSVWRGREGFAEFVPNVNVAEGYQALLNATGSRNVAIGPTQAST